MLSLLIFALLVCGVSSQIQTGSRYVCLKVRMDPNQDAPLKSYTTATTLFPIIIDNRADSIVGPPVCEDPCCSSSSCGQYSGCQPTGTNNTYIYIEYPTAYASFVFTQGNGPTCQQIDPSTVRCPIGPIEQNHTTVPVNFDVYIAFTSQPPSKSAVVSFWTDTEDTYEGLQSCNAGSNVFSQCEDAFSYTTRVLDMPVELCTTEPALPNNWTLGGNLFQTFVFDDVVLNYTDIQGRLLVGGNAWLNNVAVGMEIFQYKYLPCDKLPLGSPQYAVVVGGAVFTLGGSIHNGDLAYGNSTSNVSVSTGFNPGCFGYAQPTDPIPVNFPGWRYYFQEEAAALCNITETGTAIVTTQGTLLLTGTNTTGTEIFRIDGADLATVKAVSLIGVNPLVGAIIINVPGSSSGLTMSGMQPLAKFNSRILWNFCEATSVSLGCIDIAGSVLAPYAAADTTTGVIYGKLIVAHLTGMLQQNQPCRNAISPIVNNSICATRTGDCQFETYNIVEVCQDGTVACVSITQANQDITLETATCGVCPTTTVPPTESFSPSPNSNREDSTASASDNTHIDYWSSGEEENTKHIIFVIAGGVFVFGVIVALILGVQWFRRRANKPIGYVIPTKSDYVAI